MALVVLRCKEMHKLECIAHCGWLAQFKRYEPERYGSVCVRYESVIRDSQECCGHSAVLLLPDPTGDMNAFDMILGHGGGGGNPPKKTRKMSHSGDPLQKTSHGAQQPSRTYLACPLCQRSIPSSFVNSHATSCSGPDRQADRPPHQAKAVAVHSNTAPLAGPGDRLQSQRPLQGDCHQQAAGGAPLQTAPLADIALDPELEGSGPAETTRQVQCHQLAGSSNSVLPQGTSSEGPSEGRPLTLASGPAPGCSVQGQLALVPDPTLSTGSTLSCSLQGPPPGKRAAVEQQGEEEGGATCTAIPEALRAKGSDIMGTLGSRRWGGGSSGIRSVSHGGGASPPAGVGLAAAADEEGELAHQKAGIANAFTVLMQVGTSHPPCRVHCSFPETLDGNWQ